MKRFLTSITAFISCMQANTANAHVDALDLSLEPTLDDSDPVSLRPLNYPGENLFAGHRSHSSHSSHRSHRSSSGGSSSYRAPATRSYSPPSRLILDNSGVHKPGLTGNPTDPGRPALVSPTPSQQKSVPSLTAKEKRKIQIMRVQLALKNLGLYDGQIDGILGPKTREAITFFQRVKDLPADGKMSTETLNALGVKAVN